MVYNIVTHNCKGYSPLVIIKLLAIFPFCSMHLCSLFYI